MLTCADDASVTSLTTRRPAVRPVTGWTDARRQGGTSSRICFYSSYLERR